MPAATYSYVLRRDAEIIATGHLTPETEVGIGDTITIAGHVGTVNAIEPLLGTKELRLILDIPSDG